MAPIKFEEQIKDKLEQRTIQPSNDAWDQLSKKLNTEDKKKSKRLFFYVGIAASIVGVFLFANVIFNSSENHRVLPTVVDAQEQESKGIKSKPEFDKLENTEVIVDVSEENYQVEHKNEVQSQVLSIKNEQKESIIAEASVKTKKESKQNLQPEKQMNHIINETGKAVAVDDVKISQETIKPANKLTYEDTRALQVVAAIEKLEIENGAITESEFENLLKQAEKEILQHRIFNETTRTVDADALLQDVEADLDQSFRSRVFEGLTSRSKTLLSAVVERNN